MNNIYKVIWSKAKNCYVVASEIARSHTKSASGSEKIGGGTRRALLASLMAVSLLCGGLGVASATLEVVNQNGTAGTTTIYTKEEVDNALKEKGLATDVATNKANIAKLQEDVGNATSGLTQKVTEQGEKIATNTTNISTNKDDITSLKNTKLDTTVASATYATKDALDNKADKTYVDTEVGKKADTATTLAGYGINDAYTRDATDTAITTKVNEEKNARELKDAELSGRIDTLSNTVDSKVSKTDLNTTLGNYYTQAETNAAIKTAVDDEKNARDTAIKGEVTERNKAISDAIALEVTNRNAAITNAKTELQGKITAEETARKEADDVLKAKDVELEGKITAEETARTAADAEINKKIGSIDDTRTLYVKDSQTISQNLTKLDEKLQETNDRTGGIKRNTEDTQTTIEGKVTVDNSGNVGGVKNLSAETINTTGNATIGGDLNVTGTITTDKMIFGDKATNNYTEIDKGHITSKNDALAGDATKKSSSMELDHSKLEVGVADKDSNGHLTMTADQTSIKNSDLAGKNYSEIVADKDSVKTTVKDEKGNTTSTKSSATEIRNYAKDKDGNKTNNVQTATQNKSWAKDKDGNESSIVQTGKDITNTAEKGTITNDAKDIVNNATGDMTNTVGGNQTNTIGGNQTTTVTGDISNKAKNITNEAETKLTDKVGTNTRVIDSTSITDTVGTTTNRKIEDGKITDTAGDSTVTTKDGEGTTFAKTGSTAYSTEAGAPTDTNIAGNHITTGRVDANELGVSDKDGANTAKLTVEAGEDGGVKASASNGTTTGSLDVTAKEVGSSVTDASGKGSTFKQRIDAIMGNVKTDAGESEVTQEGNKITSVVGKGEATNSRVTQEKGSLEAAVTDGTNTNVSYDTANASAKLLTDGTKVNKQQDNLNSSEKTITNGTYSTSTVQSALDITHTAKDGTITHDAKDIVNNASNSITDKVGDHTRVLDGEGITDTVGGSTFKQRIDKIMMESKDVSIKADEKLTNEAKVITNKASEVINNEAININNTATGIITSKASEIKNQADKLISNKVGENTSEYMEDGKITTSIKDGTKQNLTQSNAAETKQSTVDGAKSTVTIQNADGLQAAVTNGTSTNASATTATSSAQTIASGSKANSVITTIDGTQFVNSDAWVPVNGASGAGTAVNTTIKGNTITTGKVTMDYADVMKDLGVHGNANIAGKTTTGSLEVKGESKLTGDVTMESNATVKKNLTVEGNTNLKNTKVDGTLDVTQKATFGDSVSIAKDLSVDGNATIKGDVTAKSYKVGDKTYISAAGINANDQKITNVADGNISEGSKDAVNGGQLYGMKTDLEHKVDKVGANAAAMANLHPMEFDPDSKWNIAAAMGNYGSETATAIGAFYRPNEDVMVNFSTAFGTGENMVGGGVSVRLGKGGNKLSREETNALKAQVNDLTARMDALLSVLNPNMSKDFPDVPENHWAYEAVSRLAGNDIVQGYPDGEFHGDRTMTRYEMAEIIYNALSRGAEAERELVEEFKPELQAMAASEKATAERAEG